MWGRFLRGGANFPGRVAIAAGSLNVAWTHCGPGSAYSPVACAPERRIEDVYDLLDNRPIGMGGFGVVCPGRHRETGEIVAIKSVSKRTMSRQRMHREADIMQLGGDHRCVVSYVDLFESPSHYYLVMEMASGGELFDRLVARGAYTEASAANLVGELAEALAYLHANGVVHFDIKPENILLHSSDSSDSNGAVHAHYGEDLGAASKGDLNNLPETTRITDFGSAFLLSAPAPERTPKPGSGTSAYLPPEALVEDTKKRQPCTETADMWSLGVVMYILLAGAHPFDLDNRASDQEIERRIREDEPKLRGGAWERVSPEGRALLAQLLQKDPARRPSAAELLTHPWMTGGAAANEAPLEDVHANLRAFGRARRRLKALLLATMLGLDKRFTTAAPAFLDSSLTASSEATAADLAAAAASIQTGHPLSTAASTAQVGYLAGELARRSTTMAGASGQTSSDDGLSRKDSRKDSTRSATKEKPNAGPQSAEASKDFFRVRRHATTAEPGEFDAGSGDAAPSPVVVDKARSNSRGSSAGGGMRRRNTAQPLGSVDEGGSNEQSQQTTPSTPPISGEVEDPMGSRKQALRLFDRGKKGYISHADLVRLLRKIEVHDLSVAEVDEMIRAADANPRGKQTVCLPEQLLKLVPPLCPARVVDPGGLVFKSGEVDPQAYLLTQGEVVLTLDPRRGGAPLEALRFKRGDLVGDAELTLSPDGAPNVLQRLWTARCVEDPPKGGATASTNGPSGCRLLAVRRELFSHLTDVFEPLENGLATRAQAQLQATLHHWINACEHASPLEADQRGATLWPPTSAMPTATSALSKTHSAAVAWSGCLLVVSEGTAEVDVLSEDPHDHSSSGGESDGGGSTVTTKTVGPGFLCYCPPVKTKHSWLGQTMLAADVNEGTSSNSKSGTTVADLASVYDMAKIPPSLQALPRCVGARVAPRRTNGHSSDKSAGDNSGEKVESAKRVVVTVVPGKDLHELLRQPGMQPLRQYIGKQSTLPASHWRK